MFVVTPLITNMPVVYGIYTVCISLNIFLNYADLGFLMAGEKFASESYSKGDKESEKSFIGTSVCIYAIISAFVIIGVLLCAWNPSLLINDVSNDESQLIIARKLLLILAASIPISVFSKFVNMVYRIRLEGYKVQRVGIIGSLITILSVPLVFFNNQYDIVGYYLFSQFITLVSCGYYLVMSKRIGYGFWKIVRLIRFDRSRFVCMKGLASSGFISSISWILYYEMDIILISTLLGPQMVALYAIGRSLNNFLRSLFNIIYSPYSVRFNYFVGNGDFEGLKSFYYTLIRLFSYFTVIPIVVFLLFAKPFVLSWVGESYIGSVLAVQILVACFLPNFFSNPALNVVIAMNKFKGMLIVSVIQPIVFYLCVFTTIWYYNINSIAFAKWVVILVGAGYYVVLVMKSFGETLMGLLHKIRFFYLLPPCLLAIVVSYLTLPFVSNVNKSSGDLIKVTSVMVGVVVIALLSAFVTDRLFRKEFFNVINIRG